MKKTGILWVLLLSFDLAGACTVCGCSSGMMGMSGQIAMGNFISFGYQSSHLVTVQPVDLENPQLDHRSFETLRTYTLSGQYKISRHILVNAILPVQVNSQRSDLDEYNVKNHGVGDVNISFGGMWNVDKSNVTHLVIVKQGFILPTASDKGPTTQFSGVAPMLLTGRGAIGMETTLQYLASSEKWGVLALGKGQLWSGSHENYRYGKAIGARIDLARNFVVSKSPVSPFATLQGTVSEKNQLKRETLPETGGYLIQTGAGVRVKTGAFLSDISIMAPIIQNQANKLISNKLSYSFNLIYQFESRKK